VPIDEGHDPTRSAFHNLYEETKFLGDQVVRDAVAGGAPVITLYPTVIFGPGTLTDGNLVGKIVRDFVRRRLPGRIGRGDATWNYAYVEDVVDGHVRALAHARPGSRYILGGENVTMDGFLDTLEEITGIPAPDRRLPRPVTTTVAFLMEMVARVTGGQPDLTRDALDIYEKDWAYSIDAARTDLGYTVTPFREALARTAEWARTLERSPSAAVGR
jgi:farnesol dehydrogenase